MALLLARSRDHGRAGFPVLTRLTLTRTLTLAAAGVLGAAPGALAGSFGDPGPGSPPPTDGSPQSTTVKSCRLFAAPDSFGLSCGGGHDTFLTVRQILGGDPLPTCWDDALPPDLKAKYDPIAAQRIAAGTKGAFYLEICLHGVDPQTLQVLPGGIHYSQTVQWIPDGREPKTLTDRQRRLVATSDQQATIPLPVVASSPSVIPRVGQDVSFWVSNQHVAGPLRFAGAGVGQVLMRARLVYLQVTPDPTDGTTVGCPGAGVVATRTDTPTSRPDGCWWRYRRSSASQPGQSNPDPGNGTSLPAYDVQAVATWVVEYDANGGWRRLATFERRQALEQPVTEIQTLVLP
jgi:hypothetical protein